jgi:hypothetical protein
MIPVGQSTAKAFTKEISFDQERKLEDPRRLDTVVVSAINDVNPGSGAWRGCMIRFFRIVHSTPQPGTVREIRVFGLRGEYGRKTEI